MILEKLAKLLDVKSIMTITFSFVFCFLSIKGDINAEQFLTIFTVVVSFYFGTQYQKNKDNKVGEDFK